MVAKTKNFIYYILVLVTSATALASINHSSNSSNNRQSLEALLLERFSADRIEVISIQPSEHQKIERWEFMTERALGQATLRGIDQTGSGFLYTVEFRIFKKAPVSLNTKRPGEKLKESEIKIQEIDITSGVERQYSKVFAENSTAWDKMMAKSTLLEGRFITVSSIKKIPDISRGDAVEVRVQSGGVILKSHGVVQTNGYIGDTVSVLLDRNKRETKGKVAEGLWVEVAL